MGHQVLTTVREVGAGEGMMYQALTSGREGTGSENVWGTKR